MLAERGKSETIPGFKQQQQQQQRSDKLSKNYGVQGARLLAIFQHMLFLLPKKRV